MSRVASSVDGDLLVGVAFSAVFFLEKEKRGGPAGPTHAAVQCTRCKATPRMARTRPVQCRKAARALGFPWLGVVIVVYSSSLTPLCAC
jgi:hypothetical protein